MFFTSWRVCEAFVEGTESNRGESIPEKVIRCKVLRRGVTPLEVNQ